MAGTEPASATTNYVVLGGTNTTTGTTSITASDGDGLQGVTTQTGQNGIEGEDTSSWGGQGVRGSSDNGTGVYGTGHAYGVYGTSE